MERNEIIKYLPYSYPFLFVDELEEINEDGVKGNYTFAESSFFYQGHFKDNPVTPGVILTECMAQIGVVSLGIYLLRNKDLSRLKVALSNIDIDFYIPVLPGQKVMVNSQKEYFRFQKLKCKVEMRNKEGKLVCRGEISGMIIEDE
ncbi:3-hydroxyacyl-ACP dehydratase FabZ family protein [Salinimicrobium flavum]|uniref:3-hydroxyacyl-ACP dehydratase FabZ family protein n=1 Tax=Salinimicrobium flavum TaxID=1737065 RepID=A0ABW5J0H7_9FLAO